MPNVQPEDEESEVRFFNLVHCGYGTGWGAVRGLLESAGLSRTAATVAHLALVWSSEQVILPTLNVSAPVFKYGGKATATDLWHHVVYATATGVAYSYLDRRPRRPNARARVLKVLEEAPRPHRPLQTGLAPVGQPLCPPISSRFDHRLPPLRGI